MADNSVSTELDTKSEECQRFFRDGLTTSFHKILNDEAVNGWKYEIHVSCKTAYYSWTSANTYLLPPRSWESRLSFSSFAAEFAASNHCKTAFPYQNHSISHLSHVEQFGVSPFLKLIRNFTLLFTPHATWKQYGGRNCLTSTLRVYWLVLGLRLHVVLHL